MVRSRVGSALVLLLVNAALVHAQPTVFTGVLTGHLGAVLSGDVRDWAVTPGISMAVLDDDGLGVEIDVAHSGDFDTVQFADSSITTAMINFLAEYRHDIWRPYFVAGAGVLRVRGSFFPGERAIGQTDTAWNAGGGVLYMLNEGLGLRGDVRYFRQFGRQDALPLGSNAALDFVRVSLGATYSWPLR